MLNAWLVDTEASLLALRLVDFEYGSMDSGGYSRTVASFRYLLKSSFSVTDISVLLKNMEVASGRIRPSHQISLDVDLIAWGSDLEHMQFNPKKLPLALDVKIPMFDVWKDAAFQHQTHSFPTVSCLEAK